MKKTVRILSAVTICALATSQAGAAIALWDFENLANSTALAPGNTRVNTTAYTSGTTSYGVNQANLSTFAATPSLTAGIAHGNQNGNMAAVTGTPSTAMQFNPAATGNNQTINLATLTLTFQLASGVSMSGGSLTLQYNYNASAASTGSMAWTLNGTGTAVNVSVGSGSGWQSSGSVTFNNVNVVSGGSFTLNEAFSGFATGETLAFDNISITSLTPVPEPITYALALFGVAFVGVGAGRFYKSRRQLA